MALSSAMGFTAEVRCGRETAARKMQFFRVRVLYPRWWNSASSRMALAANESSELAESQQRMMAPTMTAVLSVIGSAEQAFL